MVPKDSSSYASHTAHFYESLFNECHGVLVTRKKILQGIYTRRLFTVHLKQCTHTHVLHIQGNHFHQKHLWKNYSILSLTSCEEVQQWASIHEKDFCTESQFMRKSFALSLNHEKEFCTESQFKRRSSALSLRSWEWVKHWISVHEKQFGTESQFMRKSSGLNLTSCEVVLHWDSVHEKDFCTESQSWAGVLHWFSIHEKDFCTESQSCEIVLHWVSIMRKSSELSLNSWEGFLH